MGKAGQQVNEVNLSTGIEFPWNYGWTMAVSVVPGLPIRFTYENPDCTITVAAEGVELLADNEDEDYPPLQQPASVQPGDTVYWQTKDAKRLLKDEDVHFVDVLVREQGHLVGYAVVRIESRTSDVGGKAYFATVLRNVSYPKTAEGQYQAVSEEYVQGKIQEAENKGQ